MTGNQLRQKYLDFFKSQNHAILPSASLVPDNDPTTLFTGSGMQPMLPFLLGESHPQGARIADSQRCFRVQDIEEVGDNRHTTVFEMLGNWSLGDYFKKEQLPWMFEFLTQEVGLDPQRLYVSVFAGSDGINRDQEAIQIWQDLFSSVDIEAKVVDDAEIHGMQDGRIFSYGASKNWWSRSGVPTKMPVGEPGGPDSEIFYDFGPEHNLHTPEFGPHCHINCDCGRYLEIGNNVFMQYQKQADGSFKELPQKNIDFGGGLERILAAKLNTPDVFQTDLFQPIIQALIKISGQDYAQHLANFRIIADHIKAAVWLLSDGVIPSNKAQGYVLRRLIRRTVRQGQILGIAQPFTAQLAQAVQEIYGSAYPSVLDTNIPQLLDEEEQKFLTTLDRGLKAVHKFIDNQQVQPADDQVALLAFDYYQTHGLPVDIFLDELASYGQYNYSIDDRQHISELVDQHFLKHQELSRQGADKLFKGGLGGDSRKEVEYHTATHLLQQALRDVLGDAVAQRGSNITADRLRFDFTSETRLTPEQKQQVEDIVNQKIVAALPVSFTILPLAEAQQSGAIGLFGEKYGDTVKIYSIGGQQYQPSHPEQVSTTAPDYVAYEVAELDPRPQVYSREFCGGPHVSNTSHIQGHFIIQKDEKISRDAVRIKAILK